MPLITLGINHKTAPVDIREKVAINMPQYAERVRQLMELDGIESQRANPPIGLPACYETVRDEMLRQVERRNPC